MIVWQPSLLDMGEPAIDRGFTGVSRRWLDERSWIDVVPRWVSSGADELFDAILERAGWQQRNRWMYERRVDEPRRTSSWRLGGDGGVDVDGDVDAAVVHPVVESMRAALSERYGVEFDSGGLNLYRDGRDSVAWHGDRIAAELEEPIVGIVSLGHPRSFRLRPKGGGRAGGRRLSVVMQRGDLIVTGGRCQREWEHSVPKVAVAGPRLSITFRHSSA